MAWDSDFLGMMPRTITVEPWQSEAADGVVTYGTGVSHKCYIRDDAKVWKWEDGTEVQSRRIIYVSGATGSSIGRKDRITLPSAAGFEPQKVFPLWMVRHDDESGYHHTKIYC